MTLFGHGLISVFRRVINSGEIRPRDQLVGLGHAELDLDEVIENGAAPYPLWPKLADIVTKDEVEDQLRLDLASAVPWPVVTDSQTGRVRLHMGTGKIVTATIIGCSDAMVSVSVDRAQRTPVSNLEDLKSAIVTGPYGR